MKRWFGVIAALLLGVAFVAAPAAADDSVRPDQATTAPQRESGALSGMTQAGMR